MGFFDAFKKMPNYTGEAIIESNYLMVANAVEKEYSAFGGKMNQVKKLSGVNQHGVEYIEYSYSKEVLIDKKKSLMFNNIVLGKLDENNTKFICEIRGDNDNAKFHFETRVASIRKKLGLGK